jgi:hypothetical protein
MNRQGQMHNSAAATPKNWEIRPLPATRELESRLNNLADRAKEIPSVPTSQWRSENPNACAPAQDVNVKTEAARWMLRVAKHLDGQTRERVLLAVLRSLDDLENIVESQDHRETPHYHIRASHSATH